MANLKVIKGRIKGTENIRKITRTMEMISTVRSSQMTNRLIKSRPYKLELLNTLHSLKNQNEDGMQTFFTSPKKVRTVALLIIGADRGLCGGYNTQIHRLTRKVINQRTEKNIVCKTFLIGKKIKNYFRFSKLPVYEQALSLDTNKDQAKISELADHLLHGFTSGDYDRIEVISTIYLNAARQVVKHQTLLPFSDIDSDQQKSPMQQGIAIDTRNLDNQEDLPIFMQELIAQALRSLLLNLFIEAHTSEHLARRIAMKNGTDAADEILGQLRQDFNRKRQAAITQEISEIVAGSSSV